MSFLYFFILLFRFSSFMFRELNVLRPNKLFFTRQNEIFLSMLYKGMKAEVKLKTICFVGMEDCINNNYYLRFWEAMKML